MKFRHLILFSALQFFTNISWGQSHVPDSLKNKSFDELKDRFFVVMDDKKTADAYADAFLLKAKKIKNPIKIADGYVYKSYISDYEDAIKYSDSIILNTYAINHPYYPGLGYMLKGYFYYNHGNDKEALDAYLEANEYAIKTNNIKQQIEIKQFLGVIKLNMGDYRESLKIHNSQLKFLERQENYRTDYKEDYVLVLGNLARGYIRAKNIDSASYFINKGIDFSRKSNHNDYYHFLLNSGNVYYLKNDFKKALDSINKAIPYLNGSSLAMCYYYKGKIFENKDIDKSIYNYKLVDSIYQITKDPFIELREVYKALFDYYTKANNTTKQLSSVNKLLKIDSLLNKNSYYLNEHIIKDYEIPKLKIEKEKLISKIENNQLKSKIISNILTLFLLITIISTAIFYTKQHQYKIRYDKLIHENELINTPSNTSTFSNDEIGISEEVIEQILKKLGDFEHKKGFLNNNITLNKVSKDLKTNSSYLSKIINYYRKDSFSNYINELRIEYAINELKENTKLRSFTIKAISEAIGFNNPESFSKAFYKKTGIYPSFYIKQLNKGLK